MGAAAPVAGAAAGGGGLASIAGYASLVFTALSTVTQIRAQQQQRQAAKDMAEYESAVARNNQIIQERAAADVLERGRIAAAEHRTDISRLQGAQRAALASSGQVVDEGSPQQLVEDTAATGELEALRIEEQAEQAAYQNRIGASSAAAEAEIARLRGNIPDNTLATALTGAGRLASRFYTMRRNRIR